ncbi:membrane protein [Fulvitalea axinellae]|uniref:Membrane protein n=1 Tax=Fulvitalea axinellae TaxID=1182444 RepID=A0AAU9CEU4_9BACT|nr:membrane protein [Fulvitalea axinellae]
MLKKQRFEIKGNTPADLDEIMELARPIPKKPLLSLRPGVYLYETGKRRLDTAKIRKRQRKVRDKYNLKIKELEADSSDFLALEEKRRKDLIALAPGEGSDKEKIDRINSKADKKEAKIIRKRQAKSGKLLKARNKKTERLNDKIEKGNFMMRMGSPLVLLDSSAIRRSAIQMRLYLETNGHFRAKTSFNVETKGKTSTVIYKIAPGPVYTIDSVMSVRSDNSGLAKVIDDGKSGSLIKKGDVYNQANFIKERERIESLAKEAGYFDFNRRHVKILTDTTGQDHKVWVRPKITTPNDVQHKAYTIDSVNFITDAQLDHLTEQRKSTIRNDINFQYHKHKYSEKVLSLKTLVRPGTPYNSNKVSATRSQLNGLNMFRQTKIEFDSIDGKFVANINVEPVKKNSLSTEVGIDVTQGEPGPYVNLGYLTRNPFGGLEQLQISGRYDLEGVIDVNQLTKYREGGVNAKLFLPQFLIPLSKNNEANPYKWFNQQTVINAGWNLTETNDFKRTAFNTSIDYNWESKNRQKKYRLRWLEVNYINSSDISDNWEKYLFEQREKGSNEILQYSPSVITSTSFSANYNFGVNPLAPKEGSTLKFDFEMAGTWINLYDPSASTSTAETQEPNDPGLSRSIPDTLQYYQFLKTNIEFKKYFPVNEKTTLATGIEVGVGLPYGISEKLPLEKSFVLGGTKMRAWQFARIGPGGYQPPDSLSRIRRYGDIKIYSFMELRRQLIGRLGGSLFLEAGNVWLMNEDETFENGHFKFDSFIDQLGISGGYSINLDFSPLLISVGVGLKLRDPATGANAHKLKAKSLLGQDSESELFIGIGYTF